METGSSGGRGQISIPNNTAAAIIFALVILAGGIFLVARDRPVEAELRGGPTAGLSDFFVLGGADSRFFPESVVLKSLRSHEPDGYQLMARAIKDGTIRSFREVLGDDTDEDAFFEDAFRLNGGPNVVAFGIDSFGIDYMDIKSVRERNRGLAKALSILALDLYQYQSGTRQWDAIIRAEKELGSRDDNLVVFGSPEPDLASEWQGIADRYQSWIKTHGASNFPEFRRAARLYAAYAESQAALLRSPSKQTLDASNSAADRTKRLSPKLIKKADRKSEGRTLG